MFVINFQAFCKVSKRLLEQKQGNWTKDDKRKSSGKLIHQNLQWVKQNGMKKSQGKKNKYQVFENDWKY